MKLSVYDFDGTYINEQAVTFIFKLWKTLGIDDVAYKRHFNVIKKWYILHKLGLKWDKETFRKHAMAKTIDLLHSVDDKTLDSFIASFYTHMKPFINQDLKEQMLKDKLQGYHTILLSGSFDIMLEPFLKEGFDQVIGTVSKPNGKRLNSSQVEIIINEKKKDIILTSFPQADLKASKAYADSYYDINILEAVGHAVAYHPDKKLLKHALKKGWEVIYETKN